MDDKMREFLSAPRFLKCPRCNFAFKVTLKQVGSKLVCPNCKENVFIPENISCEEGTEDIKTAIEEYLREFS